MTYVFEMISRLLNIAQKHKIYKNKQLVQTGRQCVFCLIGEKVDALFRLNSLKMGFLERQVKSCCEKNRYYLLAI